MNCRTLLLFVTVICLTLWSRTVKAEKETSQYISLLTKGLNPRPAESIPRSLLETLSQLSDSDIKDAARLFQAQTHLLRKGDTAPSAACANQTAEFVTGLLGGERWALQMLDAAGKPGSGLLDFNIVYLGNYEECLAVRATQIRQPGNVTTQMFKGKYCRAFIDLAPNPSPIAQPVPFGALTFGLCFPDACNGEDVKVLLNGVLDLVYNATNTTNGLKITKGICQELDRELDTKAIAVFVISMMFVLLLVLGTLYDIVFIQAPRWYSLSGETESLLNGRDIHTSLNIKHRTNSEETTPLLAAKKSDLEAHEPSLCGKILLSFSVYTNGAKLLSTKQAAGSLTAVHGIRFLSMTWVMLGHTYGFAIAMIDNLVSFVPEVLKRFTFQGIANASVSVDSFFTLSGLLVTYLVLKEMRSKGGRINWAMFYFHRFWRLTPPYMLLLMVYVTMFPYITDGPQWPQQGAEVDQCRDTWWTNLLYINNLVQKEKMCMAWSWYLANDMQFYILSPLIFVPLFYSGVLGSISVLLFLLAALITPGVISRVHNMGPGLVTGMTPDAGGDQMAYFFDYYITPYCRMGPYIVGMVTGYLLYKTDCRIRINKWLVLLGWCVATASALAVVYGLYNLSQGGTITADVSAFYNAVNRTVWGASLCWVVFACATGHGSFVNTILSWKALIPLSRLTYCAYLVHPIVMYYFYYGQRTLLHMTDVNAVYWFFGHLVASYMAAFLVSLTFESPMMGLEKAILKREKSS